MSLPSTKWRLGMHFFVRVFEVLFLYGHFIGTVVVAGDALERVVPQLSFSAPVFAVPQMLIAGIVLALFGLILRFEWQSADMPRVHEPSAWMRRARQTLRIMLMAAIVVCFLSFVFFIALLVLANENTGTANERSWPLSAASILVSWLVLMLVTLVHLDWMRRLQSYEVSAFATVPAIASVSRGLSPPVRVLLTLPAARAAQCTTLGNAQDGHFARQQGERVCGQCVRSDLSPLRCASFCCGWAG